MSAVKRLERLMSAAKSGLIGRDVLVELVVLAAVAKEHLLVVGPPGTAKSEAVRRSGRGLGGRYFEYLLSRFTEPVELFGPIDLLKLKEGVFETRTEGMLPEADIAFLDEIFLGSSAILNTLLALLNERTFRRGQSTIDVPLRLVVGACNALPTDDSLSAFADRFMLRVFVAPVPDADLDALLQVGHAGDAKRVESLATLDDLDAVSAAARAVDLTEVRPALSEAIRKLREAGVALSDRRIVRSQRLVAAAAALDERQVASTRDLWPLVFIATTETEQAVARDALRDLLDESVSTTVNAAAEAASAASAARALRLTRQADEALGMESADDSAGSRQAVLREIDASFSADTLRDRFPALAKSRQALVQQVTPV